MTVFQNMTQLTERESCQKLAGAVIERAVEDVKLFTENRILVNGKANTQHRVFRVKAQYLDTESFQRVSCINPRDVYMLLKFFDDEIKPWLKVAGIEIAARTIKRAVIGGKVGMRNV